MQTVIDETLIRNYKEYLINEERSPKTIEKYIRDVKNFYKHTMLHQKITKKDVLFFKEFLIEHYKASSVNSILVAVNSFLSFIGLRECRVKLLKLQRRIICDETRKLKKEEYNRLLKSALNMKNKKLYMLLQTISNTGIRISEHKFITVEALRDGRVYINNKGKNRVIFISKNLKRLLLNFCKEYSIKEGPVFVTKNGIALDRSNIWSMMKLLCEDAHVDKRKVFPHNLRHLFAYTFYELEKDLVRLADILGHSSIETTRIYTKTTGLEYENQLSKLNLLVNW